MSDHASPEQSRREHGRCRDLLGELSLYIDGEAEQSLCDEIEAHMAECENCRILVDTLRKTVTLYRALPAEPLPDDVEERLYKRLNIEDFMPGWGQFQSRGKTSER